MKFNLDSIFPKKENIPNKDRLIASLTMLSMFISSCNIEGPKEGSDTLEQQKMKNKETYSKYDNQNPNKEAVIFDKDNLRASFNSVYEGYLLAVENSDTINYDDGSKEVKGKVVNIYDKDADGFADNYSSADFSNKISKEGVVSRSEYTNQIIDTNKEGSFFVENDVQGKYSRALEAVDELMLKGNTSSKTGEVNAITY